VATAIQHVSKFANVSNVLSERTIPSKKPIMDLNAVGKTTIQVHKNNPKFGLHSHFGFKRKNHFRPSVNNEFIHSRH
jgi:hypothetical protein